VLQEPSLTIKPSPAHHQSSEENEKIEAGKRPGELTADEREELKRVRKELRVWQEEREIQKRAATFVSKETERRLYRSFVL
jgi:transposase-like protein